MTNKVNNPKTLRLSNKISILKNLILRGEMSRLALASSLSLTPASITQLVKELCDENRVVEHKTVDKSVAGRKEILLRFKQEDFVAIGVTIERNQTSIVVSTYDDILSHDTYATVDIICDGDIELLTDKIREKIEQCKDKNLLGVAIAIQGIVDEMSGVSVDSYGLFEPDFAIKAEFEQRLSTRVEVVNNVSVLADSIIKNQTDNFMFIKHLPGVGCAIVVDGKVVDGISHQAGEIGHTVVDVDGEKCTCGKRGCLETKLSKKAIEKSYFDRTKTRKIASEIVRDYNTDPVSKSVIDSGLGYLALSLLNASMLIDPTKIILKSIMFDNQSAIKQSFQTMLSNLGFRAKTELVFLSDDPTQKTYSATRYMIKKVLFEV